MSRSDESSRRLFVRPGWLIIREGDVRSTGGYFADIDAIKHAMNTIRGMGGGDIVVLDSEGKTTESLTITPKQKPRCGHLTSHTEERTFNRSDDSYSQWTEIREVEVCDGCGEVLPR